jgi:hypothetical protein
MTHNDAFNLLKPLGHDEAKRRLNQAFVQKLRDALDIRKSPRTQNTSIFRSLYDHP